MTSGSGTAARVFRLPASAYLVVLFLTVGAMPIAFTDTTFSFSDKGTAQGAPGVVGWQTSVLILPVLVAFFIARWATFVDPSGVRVRAILGSRFLPWTSVRGLSVDGRAVYVVTSDGAYRLPCVHVADLGAVSRASDGHLPELADPTPKSPPQRRRR